MRPALLRPTLLRLVPAVALALSGGCGWVDSTGRQSGEALPRIEVRLDELAVGDPLGIAEETEAALNLGVAAAEGDRQAWSTVPLAAGALESCAAVDGFRTGLAAATLAEACADAADCTFGFERDATAPEGSVRFLARVPRLRAPIGLRHELTVTAADGSSGSSAYDFCLVAVNDAPTALPDGPFLVTEGMTLVIGPDDPDSLLANDSDDDDVGNLPLAIDPMPLAGPSRGELELGTDGGFRYTFPESGLREGVEDTFDYALGDGSSSARATVRVSIAPSDLPPLLEEPLAPLEAVVGERFVADLGDSFADPEGLPLRFTALAGALPASGSLSLFPNGRLVGTPLAEDVGDYAVAFVASDGERESEAAVTLSIAAPPNRAPRYVEGSVEDIDVRFGTLFTSLVAAEFDDPDGDPLRYELIGDLPLAIRFDAESGELSGLALQIGRFSGLSVRASDPAGATAESATFSIRVRAVR